LQFDLIDVVAPVAIFSMMFAMGLTLGPDDFRRVMSTPRATIVGTLLQLVALPLVGIAIARAFALPPLLTAGLVVLAACPGGLFSNLFVHFARANTALSITLTATATLATLFTLPLLVRFALAGGDGAAQSVEMPVFATAFQLGMLTVFPIFLGMSLLLRRPDARSWEPALSRISVLVILVVVGIDGFDQPSPPTEEFSQSVAPVALYTLSAVLVGTLVPGILGISARDGATIALELVVKNTMLGIVLLTQVVDFVAIVPLLAYMIVQIPIGVGILVCWRLLAHHGFVAPLPSSDID